MQHDNFFKYYFNFINLADTEAPVNCHRWAGISLIGAALGRNFYLPFGHSSLLANQYIQIIGEPAARKSTAIKIAKSVLKFHGYTNFAPEKSSLERFLMDLHELSWGEEGSEEEASTDLEDVLFGSVDMKTRAESMAVADYYIASDEFVDFIGRNNIDFISLLGTLWDYSGVYDRKLKHSKPVYINNPTLSIIAGNTPSGFNLAFPPELQGQGFFSRLLLIHAKATGKKITFPTAPTPEDTKALLDYITQMQLACTGVAKLSSAATDACDAIYKTWEPMKDQRFQHYSGRRFTHLLKLTLVCAAARLSSVIDSQDVVLANTLLTFAEYSMPKAMGEFGIGRYSIVTHKILEIINRAELPVTLGDIIKHIHNDIDSLSAVGQIMNGLNAADKIQLVDGCFLPKKEIRVQEDSDLVKPSLLLPEERMVD